MTTLCNRRKEGVGNKCNKVTALMWRNIMLFKDRLRLIKICIENCRQLKKNFFKVSPIH